MSNPSMPNIPGMGAMSDTLDFVKNLWGGMGIPGMNIPGMVMPTLSVEEINKQISDLKAVESWLTLNMNMLRNTIQALEVQSATISTLQSMSETLSKAVNPGGGEKAGAKVAEKASAPAAKKESAYSFTKTAEESDDEQETDDMPADNKPTAAEGARKKPAPGKAAAAESAAAAMANPAIWWNMLQDQFKQAVNTAMASETPATTPKTAPKADAASSKPVAKKKTAPRKRAAPPAAGK